MASKNDITGDEIKSKASTKAYEDNYDRIFGNKEKPLLDSVNHKPAEGQFEIKDKIKDRIDHLEKCLTGQAHIDRPEYVQDVIDSISKFDSALSEEDRDYLLSAKFALSEGLKWNKNPVEIHEDDGYPD